MNEMFVVNAGKKTQEISGNVSSSPPVGASTEAKQDALIAELQLKADLTETQPVSAAALPLPAGASTSAKQDTGNTSVASIDTKTPALGQALAASSTPVVLTAAQVTTLTPPAAITGFLTETDFDTKTGALTEGAPASDTASSGLNGRLQRIAQRITSLIALFPTALGQGTMATSFKVVLPSDQAAVPVTVASTTVTNTVTTKELRSATPTQTSPSVTNVNTSILALNANRLGATIYNEGAAICYMKLGATATTTSYTLQIAVGGYYEMPFGYTGAVDGITASGTATLRVTEIT